MTTGNKHGGKREGAGAKPKPAVVGQYTAETFLQAVVRGDVPAEPNQRIAAARSLLRYESPIARLPLPAKTAKEMARRTGLRDEQALADDWKEKSEAIRAKHGRNGSP